MSCLVSVIFALHLAPSAARADFIFSGQVNGGIAGTGPVFFGLLLLPLNETGPHFVVGATPAELLKAGNTIRISRETDPNFYLLSNPLTSGKVDRFNYWVAIGDGGGVGGGSPPLFLDALQKPTQPPKYIREISFTFDSVNISQSSSWTSVGMKFTGRIETDVVAPEPGSLTLLVLGGAGIGFFAWRRRSGLRKISRAET
jgi:hypothetical protein